MMKLLLRIFLVTVLIAAYPAHATLKYYQSNSNIPFIEMMLNMMTVMGILDKVPVNYMHDIAAGRYNAYRPGEYAASPYYGNPYDSFGNIPAWSGNRFDNNCRSILCGNNASALNGLWVAENGEMLGVKNHMFLWHDGSQNYLTGSIQVNKTTMITRIKGVSQPIPYYYVLKNNRLQLRDRNNIVKTFRRIRTG